MIVPAYRLALFAGVLLLPLSVLVAIDPGLLAAAAVLAGAFFFTAALDGALAYGRLGRIRAVFPDLARLTKDREGEVPIEIVNDTAKPMRVRLGLAFPADFRTAQEDIVAALPKGAARARVAWPCTPLRRGNYIFENVYLETASLLGLWAVRDVSPARGEVRVYPNVFHEQKHLAALFLRRGPLGIHAHRQVGKGREFEKLRDYIPGDSYDDIHWKATARRARPITKVFQIERTQEIYVVLDASRLSARTVELPVTGRAEEPGVTVVTHLERFVTAAMVLGLVAERQGDLFGVAAFDDQVRAFVRAKNGKAHYSACRDALYTLEPRRVNPDFSEVSSFLRLRLRRRALLMFLTNLDDPLLAENFVRNLDVLGRHHLVLVNMLTSPDVAPVFAAPNVEKRDDLFQRLGGHLRWQELRELQTLLRRQGASLTLVDNEMLCPKLVTQYINVKRRQIL